jgi:hypothetical protein
LEVPPDRRQGAVVILRWNAVIRDLHFTHESITDRGYGGDVARLSNIVAQQTPEHGNAPSERAFRNLAVVPNSIQKFIFRRLPARDSAAETVRLYRP